MFYRDHLEMQYGGVITWRARRDGIDLYLAFHRLLEFEQTGLVAFAALVVFQTESRISRHRPLEHEEYAR